MAQGGSVTIKVLLDTTQFTTSAAKVKSDLEGIKSEGLKQVDADAKAAGESMDGLSQKTQQSTQSTKENSEAQKQHSESTKQSTTSTKSWADAVGEAGKKVESVGGTLTKTLTPAMVAIGAASVAAAVEIDTSLTNVRKTVDGTEQQYQQLKQAAIEFSKTNAVSASQILDIQALGAQLGFSIEELQEFGEVVSGLDIATNMDAETAATEMAHFANITKMSHDEISNYGSTIVDLGNNFATTESDISHMAMRVAAAGSACGMSQADILGLATALTSMGIEAEAGGTAISTIMSRIDKDVAFAMDAVVEASKNAGIEVGQVCEVWGDDYESLFENVQVWADAAGMSASQFAEAWQNDPVTALAALMSGLEGATYEGSNMSVMLEELGITSLRQTDVMKRLAGNSSLVGEAVETANRAWVENTALAAEVENRNNSLAAKFEMLKNRVVAVADQIGVPLANALLAACDAAEPLFEMIEEAAQAFSEMDEEQQRLVITVGALAAALGPLMVVLGKSMQSFSSISTSVQGVIQWLSKLGASGTQAGTSFEKMSAGTKVATTGLGAFKVALAGLGIAAAVAAIGLLVEAFQKLDDVPAAAREMQSGFSDAISRMKGDAEGVGSSLDSISNAADSVSNRTSSAFEQMEAKVKAAFEGLTQSTADFNSAWDGIDANAAMLDSYIATIEDLTSKTKLNADEQAQLALAVQGYNEATGSNVEIIDASTGLLSDNTEALKLNAEAWEANARAQAAQEYAKDIWKDLIPLQEEAIKMAEEYGISWERASDGTIKFGDTTAEVVEKMGGMSSEVTHDWASMKQGIESAQKALGVASDTAVDAQKSYMELTESANQASSSFEALSEALASIDMDMGGGLSAWAEETGTSLDEVAAKLSAFGFSVEDLNNLTTEQFNALVGNWSASESEMVAICEQMGIEVPDQLQKMARQSAQELGEIPKNADEVAQQMEAKLQLMSTSFKTAFVDNKVGIEEFCTALADAGVSFEEFSSLSDAQLQLVIEAFGRSKEEGLAMFETLTEGFVSTQDAIAQFIESTAELGEGANFKQWADDAGISVQQLAQTLSDFGFSVEDMQNVTTQQLELLVSNSNASTAELVAAFQAAGVEIPPPILEAMNGVVGHIEDAKSPSESGAQQLHDAVKNKLDPLSTELSQIGNDSGSGFASGLSGHEGDASSAGSSLYNAVDSELSKTPDQAQQYGDEAGSNFSDGVDSHVGDTESAAQAHYDAVDSGLQNTPDQAQQYGDETGSNFAQAIQDHEGDTQSAAEANATATEAMNNNAGSAFSWGADLVQGFINGITSLIGAVASAASAVASAVSSVLHFTKPDEGPLKEGTEIYGKHLVQGFVRGMDSERSAAANMAEALAQDVRNSLEGIYGDSFDYMGLERQGEQAVEAMAKGAKSAMRDSGSIIGGIDWYSTSGIYASAEMMGYRGAEPSRAFGGAEGGTQLADINVTVNVARIENSANEDGAKAAERISREIAIKAQAKLKGTGRA